MGAPLVTRERGNITLTRAGHVLANRAKAILADVDEAVSVARTAAAERKRVRIGFLEYAYSLIAPTGLDAFAANVPDVSIEPLDQQQHRPAEAVLTGALELAFAGVSDPDGAAWPKGVEVVPIFTEPLAVIVTTAHPLAKVPAVALPQLADERLIVFLREHAPDVYDSFLRAFKDKRISPWIELEVGLLQTMLNGVRSLNGVGIAPVSVGRHEFPGLVVVPLAGPDAPAVSLQLVWRAADEHAVYRDFAQWMTDTIKLSP